jgi:putative MATE family efflux protein
MDERALRERLLTAPLVPLILELAWPVIVVLLLQTLVGIAETFYVSFLGTDALAGVALVFPIVMLMTMMSRSGIGGGVSSAVARAIGAGRSADANALVLHALVLAVMFGVTFTIGVLGAGPILYLALGGNGRVLDAALTYSKFVFAGAAPIWIVNLFAAALQGAANVRTPAIVTFTGTVVLMILSPALIFGIGPFPRLGIAGAGTAVTLFYTFAALALLWIMASGRFGLTLKWVRLEVRLFKQILGVGLPSALGTLQLNATVIVVTGAVGLFGRDALAGYGTASRLDYVLTPLLFGLGTAVVTLVGISIGAGNARRARQITWIAALLAVGFTEIVGLFVAIVPTAWLRLFSHDPAVLTIGALYLRRVGPVYGAIGLGLVLYFASQGIGRMAAPILSGTIKLFIAAGLGWVAVAHFGAGLSTLFFIIAAAAVVSSAITAIAVGVQMRTRRSIGDASTDPASLPSAIADESCHHKYSLHRQLDCSPERGNVQRFQGRRLGVDELAAEWLARSGDTGARCPCRSGGHGHGERADSSEGHACGCSSAGTKRTRSRPR